MQSHCLALHFYASLLPLLLMIAASEFRVGNKVLLQKELKTVVGVVATLAGYNVYLSEGQNAYLAEELEPVPLSKAMAENCWFGLSEDGFWYEHVSTTLYPIYLMELNGAWMFSLTDPCGIAYWKPISWLHQLQNLYFALTNEELEIAA